MVEIPVGETKKEDAREDSFARKSHLRIALLHESLLSARCIFIL